jgi:hypothetical protein
MDELDALIKFLTAAKKEFIKDKSYEYGDVIKLGKTARVVHSHLRDFVGKGHAIYDDDVIDIVVCMPLYARTDNNGKIFWNDIKDSARLQ